MSSATVDAVSAQAGEVVPGHLVVPGHAAVLVDTAV
jgi:hypothetical protein